jgi:hypothetical protein
MAVDSDSGIAFAVMYMLPMPVERWLRVVFFFGDWRDGRMVARIRSRGQDMGVCVWVGGFGNKLIRWFVPPVKGDDSLLYLFYVHLVVQFRWWIYRETLVGRRDVFLSLHCLSTQDDMV